MRAIFFNIWHGQVWQELKKFLENQKEKCDIFGFAEVDPAVYEKIKKVLPGFDSVYDKGAKVKYFDVGYEGRALFVSKNIKIIKSGKKNLYKKRANDAGGLLFADLENDGKLLSVGMVHGKSRPGSKFDTPIRLRQSQIIIDKFKDVKDPVIVGGDFNLNPDTQSVAMFEKAGYRNLIKDFGIKSTRNKINWENRAKSRYFVKQYFADYCFTSPKVKVVDFQVPNIEASDHEPLILDFSFDSAQDYRK